MSVKMMHLFSLVLAFFTVGATAHSRLTYPPRERDPHCPGAQGCSPCMKPESWADNGFSATNPGALWKRGQEVKYVYERNNHQEGIVRLAILPMDKREDKEANDMFTFMYHCYAAHEEECPTKEVCGSARSGLQYSVKFTVPTVIPDGVYHFSWTWWGGGSSSRNPVSYTSMYSCSVVQISGGAPLEPSWPVLFEASQHKENDPGKCASHTRSEDECKGPGRICPNKPELQILPDGFSSAGESPDRFITPAMYGATDIPESSVQLTQPIVETTAVPTTSIEIATLSSTTAVPETGVNPETDTTETPRAEMISTQKMPTTPAIKCHLPRR